MSDSVLRAENKYLTKIVSVFGVLITVAFGCIGAWQVRAMEDNTAQIRLLREDITKINIVTNDRINQITNRLEVGREKSVSAYKGLRKDVDHLLKEINIIKQELY